MISGEILWKPALRKAVTGKFKRFRLISELPPLPERLISPGLYLHVPFCRSLCPYCPYNRVEYESSTFEAYQQAVKQEIDLYAGRLMETSFKSLYIGGGTPTVNWPGLVSIIAHLRDRFRRVRDICVEVHPANIDNDCLNALRDAGVTMLSIGVESTSDRLLRRIRRSHSGKTAVDAVVRALRIGFDTVNVDLMFALPDQEFAEWRDDVRRIVELGVDQLSTYPMFSFPYSELNMMSDVRHVEQPPHRTVRKMLRYTDDYCTATQLQRCSVWSWRQPGKSKFSSVSRHHYIGFGPSAASMTGTYFYLNTFDVNAYVRKLPHEHPIALSARFSRRMEMAYWLYWRVYELEIVDDEFQAMFGTDSSLDSVFGYILRPLASMGLLERTSKAYRVTASGAYWIHRLQNEYSLNYINRLWGTCRRNAWPQEVLL